METLNLLRQSLNDTRKTIQGMDDAWRSDGVQGDLKNRIRLVEIATAETFEVIDQLLLNFVQIVAEIDR